MGDKPVSGVAALKPYPAFAYAELDLNRLAVFVIDLLVEQGVPTTLENIAVACFKVFPRRFAMVGFPEYPDVARVNRALLQLRPKYRNWAIGKTRLGWQLTPAGRAEAQALREKLAGVRPGQGALDHTEVEAEPAGKVKRTIHPEDTVERLRKSVLFARYKAGWQGVEPLEVFDALEAYTHTPGAALRQKLRLLRSTVASTQATDVVEFLDALHDRFGFLFDKR